MRTSASKGNRALISARAAKQDESPLAATENYGGGFRRPQRVEYLKRADFGVTNLPLFLFSECVTQLVEHGKQFPTIGSEANGQREAGAQDDQNP